MHRDRDRGIDRDRDRYRDRASGRIRYTGMEGEREMQKEL